MEFPSAPEDYALDLAHVYDDAFAALHAGLTVSLISTPRKKLMMCYADDSANKLRQRADEIGNYDYLPVLDCASGENRIVGLFCMGNPADGRLADEVVGDNMIVLSEANLIGAGASIREFISGVRSRPICLTVSGHRIDGLVSWTDHQKLPIRAALIGLITGIELSMSNAIKLKFRDGEGWLCKLSRLRRRELLKDIECSRVDDSEVDALLHTQFCDKSTIVRKSLRLGRSKRELKRSSNESRI